MNEKIITIIATIVIGCILSIIAGTIIWIIWPYVIPTIFPGLVKNGMIISNISWWTAVLLSWMCQALFSSNYTNNKEK